MADAIPVLKVELQCSVERSNFYRKDERLLLVQKASSLDAGVFVLFSLFSLCAEGKTEGKAASYVLII